MNHQISVPVKMLVIGVVLALFGIIILNEHLHDGVVTHHLLHRTDLPGISNWWGFLLLPIVTVIVLFHLDFRLSKLDANKSSRLKKSALKRLLISTLFGILVSILFTIESPFLGYIFLALPLIALFTPIYYPEYWLGFILGTMYALGVFIPFIFGALYILVFWLLFQLSKQIKRLFRKDSK